MAVEALVSWTVDMAGNGTASPDWAMVVAGGATDMAVACRCAAEVMDSLASTKLLCQ